MRGHAVGATIILSRQTPWLTRWARTLLRTRFDKIRIRIGFSWVFSFELSSHSTQHSFRPFLNSQLIQLKSYLFAQATSTEDAPSDVAQRSKAKLLSNIAKVNFRDFMAPWFVTGRWGADTPAVYFLRPTFWTLLVRLTVDPWYVLGVFCRIKGEVVWVDHGGRGGSSVQTSGKHWKMQKHRSYICSS